VGVLALLMALTVKNGDTMIVVVAAGVRVCDKTH